MIDALNKEGLIFIKYKSVPLIFKDITMLHQNLFRQKMPNKK